MSKPSPLRALRKKKKMTLEQLADAAHMSTSYLSRLETGERKISLHTAAILAKILGVFEFEILGLVDFVPIVGELIDNDSVQIFDNCTPFTMNDTGIAERITRPAALMSSAAVALINNGYSLGKALNGWILYYEANRRLKIEDCVNRLCALGLPDGSVLVKIISLGRSNNRYDLESQIGITMKDQALAWASPIAAIVPAYIAGDFVNGVDRASGLPI